jgi:DNA (cytosine-5)-methyltransferase 1
MKKLNIIDLFAGCGGLSDGFDQSEKYKTIACVEWEKEPCNTLMKRLTEKWGYKNAKEIVLQFDIQRTSELINGWQADKNYGNSKGLDNLVSKYANGKVDVIIGGPPCQAYSLAGRIRDENGMNDDYRNFLFESYLKVVSHYKPKAFIFENVPGLLSAQPGGVSIVDRITKDFAKEGYIISSDLRGQALIDCSEYGVPQARKRLVILGINKRAFKTKPKEVLNHFYDKILPKHKKIKRNVLEAIGDLPKIYPLESPIKQNKRSASHFVKSKINIDNHEPRTHSSRDINTFKLLAKDIEIGEYKYASVESLKELYYKLTGKRSNIHKYHVLRRDKPSNTIPAHLYKDGLRHIHPDSKQARTITVREAARLQSFDDDFVFTGSMTEQYKMIGNAVPPVLGKAIADSLFELLDKIN